MIPKVFITDLLSRLDIVDVVERYVPLKKAGKNHIACCPFHSEKSQSFTVSQTKQFYHCFGCGAHGTVIGFIMEHTGIGFVAAVELLAKSAGIAVPQDSSNVWHEADSNIYDLMQSVTRYYREQLKKSKVAIDYLKGRGLSGEVAARFGIGYAPGDWQNLKAAVPDYKDVSLVEAGMVIEGDGGKRYDRFRNRIMFPIVNARGQVTGFAGRVIGDENPKYLNSPKTSLFQKNRELYGLYQAQKPIRAQKRVIAVTGYIDVLALVQCGIDATVSTLGHVITSHQVAALFRMSERVVFCFNGQEAGAKSARCTLENILPQMVDGKRIDFVFLPENHDPDTFVREFGAEAFERLIGDSLPLQEYLMQEITAQLDLLTQVGRSALLQKAQPLLTAIIAPTTALLLRKEVAVLAGVTLAELEKLWPTGLANGSVTPKNLPLPIP